MSFAQILRPQFNYTQAFHDTKRNNLDIPEMKDGAKLK